MCVSDQNYDIVKDESENHGTLLEQYSVKENNALFKQGLDEEEKASEIEEEDIPVVKIPTFFCIVF